MAKVIGIDLGTSNSACAVMEHGRPTLVPSAEGTSIGGKAFRVLIVVPGPTRLRALKRVVENEGGKRMFWFATLPDVTAQNIDAPIWQLAGEKDRAALFDGRVISPPLQAGGISP